MTFPRPCLYALLAACLLLPGCVANQYAIKINAITNGDIQAGIGDVYYIMAVKGQEDDLVFLELKRNLESAQRCFSRGTRAKRSPGRRPFPNPSTA